MTKDEVQNERSVPRAFERVVEASQRALLARIELLRLEAEEDLFRTLRGAIIAFAGLQLLGGAWLALMGLAVSLLQEGLSLVASLILVGLACGIAGGFVLLWGSRILGRLRLMKPDIEPKPTGDSR